MEEHAVVPQAARVYSTFSERIDRLPPLQRAFVFSEILGPPKGMG
jgi:hypothetical protein